MAHEHILTFTTLEEVHDYLFDRPNGPETVEELHEKYTPLIERVLARGDGLVFFENHDLGSPTIGCVVMTSFGSTEAQFEVDTIDEVPSTLPDGIPNPDGSTFNWRYQITAVYRPS